MKQGAVNILIVPDSFKGTLSSKQVALSLERGVRRAASDADVEISVHLAPFSDGGEGFLETIESTLGGHWMNATCRHVDLHLPPRTARWLWHAERGWAIGESAEVIGVQVTQSGSPGERTAVGIADYLEVMRSHRPERIILGVGGTSTYDGGVTVSAGLGTQFYDAEGEKTVLTGLSDLRMIAGVKQPQPWEIPVECWCDVKTPLLGAGRGASLYAAQKGASAHETVEIERWISRWTQLLDNGRDRAGYPGTGAGGGLPYGLMTAMDVQIKSGAEELMGRGALNQYIEDAELILSGEGRIDETSSEGKLLDKIHDLCLENCKSAIFFTGSCRRRPDSWDQRVQIVSPEGEGSGDLRASVVSERWLAVQAELSFLSWIKGRTHVHS